MAKRKFGVFLQQNDKCPGSNQKNLIQEKEPSSNAVDKPQFFLPYDPSKFGQSFRCRFNLEENQKAQPTMVDGINFESFHIQSGSFSNENKEISDDAKEILRYVQKLREEKTMLISKLATDLDQFKKDLHEAKIENVELRRKLKEGIESNGRENQSWDLSASCIAKYQNMTKTYQVIVEKYDELKRSIAKINDDYSAMNSYFKEEKNNLEEQIDAFRINYDELKNKYLEDSEKFKKDKEILAATVEKIQLEVFEMQEIKAKLKRKIDHDCSELFEVLYKIIDKMEYLKKKKTKSTEELQELLEHIESNRRTELEILAKKNQWKPEVLQEKVSHFEDWIKKWRPAIASIKHLDQNHLYSDIEQYKSLVKRFDLTRKYDKLEQESFKLTEDVRVLYFTVKDLKLKSEIFSNEKKSFITEIQQKKQQIAILEQDLEQCKNEIMDLHDKSKRNDEIRATFETVTANFQKMAESKEKMYQEKNEEKDQIITDLKQKNAEYLEKYRLVQMEKDNLFRNFHEFVLNAQRQTSSLSVSSVTPIIKADGKESSSMQQSPAEKIESIPSAIRGEAKLFNVSNSTKKVGNYFDDKRIVVEKKSIIKPASPYYVQRKKIKLNSSNRSTANPEAKSFMVTEEKEEEINKEKKSNPKTVTFSSDVVDNEKFSAQKLEKSSRQLRRTSLMVYEGKESEKNPDNKPIDGGSWINEGIFEF